MSAGDITRLNRMYNCPNFEVPPIVVNDTTRNLTRITNETVIMRVELHKIKDNTSTPDDLTVAEKKNEIESNLNDTLTSDDDDMILNKEQIDALYSLNAAKRNGLKSAFHHWPLGTVSVEIDPTFRKDFTAFFSFSVFCVFRFL